MLILCYDSCKKDAETYSKTCNLYSLIWEKYAGRTVLVYEKQRDTREVHQIGEEHVRNCSELSSRNKRTLRSGSLPPPMICFRPFPVSTIIEQVNKRTQLVWMKQLEDDAGVPCDMTIPPLVNGNIHKRIVQQAMLYEMKTEPMASMKKLVGTDMNV